MEAPGPDLDTAVLDQLADGVVLADGSGRVTALNTAAEAMLGTSRTLAVGADLAQVVALQDREGNEWTGCNRVLTGLTTRSMLSEQSWFTVDGDELLVTARLVRGSPREPLDAVAVSLRGARARARLDRERSDLVATVAHELRSPLTGVKGFVATLLSKWERLNDEQKKLMLTTVNADADRLARLIAELLDVARIDTGRLTLSRRPLDVVAAVEPILESVRAGTSRKIRLESDGDLPLVPVDPDKFAQVVTNLVENGVRHGEGAVTVTTTAAREPAPGVVVRVDDEGDGISPQIRSRVFTKFWKHGVRGGSGLGMYIVHGLVAAHGGEVEIGESVSGGARVSVFWPVEHDGPG